MHMRKKLNPILFVAVCVSLFAIGVSSVRADLLANISSTGDNTLFQANNNDLGDPGIFAGTDGGTLFKYGLMAFNISTIPAGATITSATLDLYIGMVAGSSGSNVTDFGPLRTISLYDESQAWGASTNVASASSFNGHGQGSAANPGDATWNYAAYNTTAWSTGDPANITSTSTSLATTSGIEGTNGAEVQWTSTALATEVQGWVNTPSTNNGLVVVNDDSTDATDFLAFWGAQGAANAKNGMAPVLAVTYVVPEPLSASLVLFGAPILLCRRRGRMPK
jgi:hypothetical protein